MHKIGDVAKLIGVKTHTIRFWEGKFDHIKSVNNKTRTRYYNSFAINELVKIKELVYIHGVTLGGIVKMVSNGKIKHSMKKMEKMLNNQQNLFDKNEPAAIDSSKMKLQYTEICTTINLALTEVVAVRTKINEILNSQNVQ